MTKQPNPEAPFAQPPSWADQDRRWQALSSRDPSSDGAFFYAVITTGIYCRPTCPSRTPKPENVRYFSTCEEAEQAGYIPCKRCCPKQPSLAERQAEKITLACRLIESSATSFTLAELANQVGLSKYHFHRLFRQKTGLTPKAYAMAKREQRLRESIHQQGSITDAIYAAGYNANSRFYEQSGDILGMRPEHYRQGGEQAEIRFAIGECHLGAILVAQSRQGLCAILLGDDPEPLIQELQDLFPKATLIGGDKSFEDTIAQVIGFVEAPEVGLDLPLDIRGTAFQKKVWQALRSIPPGETLSYADIARHIGAPKSARAVAQACAANKLAVAIPCHRVVHHDGALSGYRWGVERKQALLNKEAEGETL
ncbi:bifunctional DNA-binding transcriptional regulator/O6-methylguanine-DNA methyltransferase Ada [Hahella ganghwensis]|uniref:bifunctional DNA-binding transcriptional regulator/O6-methylguanine-DNA methyltransferase Ada n=1 Tax=Hahella ganghwensis TaxID=286420 RepID=UPI000477AB91|nr:bifunctional DNA-binding transcriptional regulator/O6-methylguanine-DNA methyltransferase Ada [Hahella ganghwensis]